MGVGFSTDFPADCPFPEASAANGEVFRITKNNVPSGTDFLTHYELGKMKNACQCLRRGLSVMRNAKDAMHQRNILPFLGEYISIGNLSDEDGMLALTNGKVPTHSTWWPYENIIRHMKFKLHDEVDY